MNGDYSYLESKAEFVLAVSLFGCLFLVGSVWNSTFFYALPLIFFIALLLWPLMKLAIRHDLYNFWYYEGVALLLASPFVFNHFGGAAGKSRYLENDLALSVGFYAQLCCITFWYFGVHRNLTQFSKNKPDPYIGLIFSICILLFLGSGMYYFRFLVAEL